MPRSRGAPVQNGLYVMPLAVVGDALLGSSRHLFVGPSATVATLSASSVAVVATASMGSAGYIALTCSLTLMVAATASRAASLAPCPSRQARPRLLDLLTDITAASLDATNLDEQTLMLLFASPRWSRSMPRRSRTP